jgi:5,10-methenyltetrahydrofolate synthetase
VPGPRLTEVAPGVLVATSRFMATSTVVVASGRDALVVDPGVHLDELESLGGELLGWRVEPVGGFATHAHWDHVLWHRDLGDVPRWASAATVTDGVTHHHELVDQAEAVVELDDERLGLGLTPVEGALPWSGPDAVLVTHDAHAAGHTALHLPDLGLLVAGDMGSDVEVPLLGHGVPGPQALLAYHEGLERLAALDAVDVVVTGHGHVCDGAMWRRRLDADRRYLDDISAGRPSDDTRLVEPWLVDADAGMRASLTKRAWRYWVRSLDPPTPTASSAVRDGLAAFLGTRPGLVASYLPLPGEVDLGDLLSSARQERPLTRLPGHATVLADVVAMPRVEDDGTVTWRSDEGDRERHHLGFDQPEDHLPHVDPFDLDVVLVPGRLFDRHGTRLGRGGGHYDRLLPRLRPGAAIVGVTVDDRIVPCLPTERHDRPMTHLATQSGVRAVHRTTP